MPDKIETASEPGVATAPTAAQQIAVWLEVSRSRLQMFQASTHEVMSDESETVPEPSVATYAESQRKLELERYEVAVRRENGDRRRRERERDSTSGGSYAVPDNTVPEPVVATAPTAAEQMAVFYRQEEVKRYQAGQRAAAENKANRERERASWRS